MGTLIWTLVLYRPKETTTLYHAPTRIRAALERCAKQLMECHCSGYKCLEDGLEIAAIPDRQLIRKML